VIIAQDDVALSRADFHDLVARTVSLLVDECGLGAGATAAVKAPAHWQTAAVLFGAWSAGLTVSFQRASTAGLEPAGGPYEVLFVTADRQRSMLEDMPEAAHKFIVGEYVDLPDGYRSFAAALPASGSPVSFPGPDAWATVDGSTYREWGSIAQDLAQLRGYRPGDQVHVDPAIDEEPLQWLLAPLVAGASIVIAGDPKPLLRGSSG
jgi:uncharacterized protein (TIGR03089 family)